MKTKHYLLAIFAALVLAGCYDDDKLWNAVNEQEKRIESLESWQKLVNNNIEALQTLVSGKHYITEVTPVMLEGKTVGYTIAFNDHAPITIYNGEKGEQGDKGDKGEQGDKGDKGDPGIAGSTPTISITQQADGNWYWTLNGALMKDASGNPIRANGQDGEDGQPGQNGEDGQPGQNAPTPVLNTGQALTDAGTPGTWTADAIYLSVDNGKNWMQVSGRNGTDGNDGDSFFSSVDTTSEDYVAFTLAGGAVVKVPRYKALLLNFSYTPAGGTETTIDPVRDILIVPEVGDLVIKYNVSGNGIVKDDVRVSAFIPSSVASGKITVSVDRSQKSVTIHTTDNNLGAVTLFITATDNAGHSCTYELDLQTPYEGGDGTLTNPYKIFSAEGLAYLSGQVNAGEPYSGTHFQLTRDIDLKGRNWKPIGRFDNHFAGSFDGGGKSISNLFVEILNYAGLFGAVKGGGTAVLKNITLLSPQVKVGSGYCGALAGYCEFVTLENCYVKDGKSESDWATVGSLVGAFYFSTMLNCHAEGMEVTGSDDVGGLIGIAHNEESNEIKKCSATKCVVTGTGDRGHGGLIGTFSAHKLKLKGCYTTGSITSLHGAVGALVGEEITSGGIPSDIYVEMTGCYSTMTIQSNSYEDSELTLMCKGLHSWKYTDCYYITPHVGQTPTSGLTYYPIITSDMINAMNAALGSEIYKEDGTFK